MPYFLSGGIFSNYASNVFFKLGRQKIVVCCHLTDLAWNDLIVKYFSSFSILFFFSLVGRCIKTWHLNQSKWKSTEYSQTFFYLSHLVLLLRMGMVKQHFFMSYLMLGSYVFRNVKIFYICCFLMFCIICLWYLQVSYFLLWLIN